MKKIAIVLFVVAAALAGCGKKKAPASPAGGDMGSAAGSAEGSAAGSADGSAAPAEGAGSGS